MSQSPSPQDSPTLLHASLASPASPWSQRRVLPEPLTLAPHLVPHAAHGSSLSTGAPRKPGTRVEFAYHDDYHEDHHSLDSYPACDEMATGVATVMGAVDSRGSSLQRRAHRVQIKER